MSFPAEGMEAAYKNNIDAVRALLDERHQDHYAVYNISPRQYSPDKCVCVVLHFVMHHCLAENFSSQSINYT